MNKNLEFKIKVEKNFDRDVEAERTNYYVKKKNIFGWWYVTSDDSDEWCPVFFGTFMLDALLLIGVSLISKYWFDIELASFKFFFFFMLSLRLFWFLMSFKILKKDFLTKNSAMQYIKDQIRKSNLEEYHTTEDIKITYKNGNLEVEK